MNNGIKRLEKLAIITYYSDDSNLILIKIDSNAEEQWNMTYGGAGYEWIDSIYQINDGSYIIGCDLFPIFALIKINPGREIQWIKNYEDVDSFQQTFDGGFILAGDKNSDFLMIKLGKDEPVLNASFSFDPGYPGVEQIVTFDATPSFDPGGNTRSEEIPKGTPNILGFSSLLAGSSLLVWIYFVCIRQRLVK